MSADGRDATGGGVPDRQAGVRRANSAAAEGSVADRRDDVSHANRAASGGGAADMHRVDAEGQQLAERCVATMLEGDAFSRWLGLRVVSIAPRAVTVQMTVRDEMLNGFGVCHGGVTFALADSALAFASNTHGRVSLSVENGISYPTSVRAGDMLTAVAAPESVGGRLGFYRVVVTRQDGDTVAIFRGTVYSTNRPLLPDQPSD